MKTAVDRVGRGKQRDVNARFKAMPSHYVFEPEFCNPAGGWEKGQVEKNVRDARNRYSVPASFANRPVSLRVYPERLVIVAEGQTVCTHERIIDRSHRKPGRVIYDWRHYLAVMQRKPGALRNGAPFIEMPDTFRRLQDHMLRKDGGDREMVDILSLVLHHDESAVLRAVELALEAGVPTKTHILNRLHSSIDPKQTDHPEIDPPDALTLETPPTANVDRYDDLRQTQKKRNAS